MPDSFIGCATDTRFVVPTAVMLSSVDINGAVPNATVLVAAFGLSDDDRRVIRAGAGGLAARLQFIDIEHAMTSHIERTFSEQYSPAIFGRFFFVDRIHGAGARLLFLDSDMIVNASLLPVFNMDLGVEFFAAVHDSPRKEDMNYFNAGMMFVDVDGFKQHNISARCLDWLAINPNAAMGDQDALNEIVGNCWYRLDSCWNRYLAEERPMNLHDYESARIAHFANEKPWNNPNHAGAKLYDRYLNELNRRLKVAGDVGPPGRTVHTRYDIIKRIKARLASRNRCRSRQGSI